MYITLVYKSFSLLKGMKLKCQLGPDKYTRCTHVYISIFVYIYRGNSVRLFGFL